MGITQTQWIAAAAPVRRRKSADWAEVVVAALLLLFMAPLFVVIIVAIFMTDGGAPMFAHPRIGRDGKMFRCLKFRSMRTDAEGYLQSYLDGNEAARLEWQSKQKLAADPRITPIGAFLRKSSLDELPQVINVLRGEMSLVGPRPIVQAEVYRYGRYFRDYCSLRPGITGLWQVSGRSETSYRRRVAMDVLYARRQSPMLYGAVLAQTLPAVLRRQGAY